MRLLPTVRSTYLLLLIVFWWSLIWSCRGQTLSPRIVKTKQGSLKGVLVIPPNRELQPVEAFLGLPYASPPVGALRYMPPVSPISWNGIRLMDKYGPACPQTLPDITNEREALRFVTRGRLLYLRKLLPYLRNQSEDCLYLNIYAPVTVGGDVNIKFPVIVFIHGESYEWNSGNPYDGSILASYGDVVVVTLNFRLGVLGFLRPDLRENRAANFGLLDQIAALHWIQENIRGFNGDPESVTLIGHGTGAACVNLLLISPVAQTSNGLFHRAILMSGTAISDWATTDNPTRYTLQASQQVDCPLAEKDDELATCLRFKRVTELMSIRLQAPLYASPLAPIVDGIVVPNEPYQSMKTYNDLFGRYDIMYGVTQSESFHLLNAATLQFGLTETERNRIIRTYVRNSFASNIDQVTAAILNEYTDWKNPVRGTLEYRDSILDILSDARVVAPVIQMGDLHSAIRQRSYFYVFSHQTTNGDYPQTWGSIHGEELPYIFGMPLVGGTNHLAMNYTRAEMFLSEMVITYFSNFARTGNPNFPPRHKFLTVNKQRDGFEPSTVQWPAYDRHSQKYLNIELRPKVKDHYRAEKMALWTRLIPELVSNSNGKITTSGSESEDEEIVNPVEGGSTSTPVMGAQPEAEHTAGALFPPFPTRPTTNNKGNAPISSSPKTEDNLEGGSIALSIVIVIGICFLVLNVCACAGVFYQRDRVRFKEVLLQRQWRSTNDEDEGHQMTERGRQGIGGKNDDGGGGGGGREEDSGDDILGPLSNQASTISTMDPHTKVSQWMVNQEMVNERNNSQTLGSRSTREKSACRRPGLIKVSSSDCTTHDDSSVMFPLLNETDKNIYQLMRTKFELEQQSQSQPTESISNRRSAAIVEVVPALDSRAPSAASTMRRKNKKTANKRDVAVGDDEGDYRASIDIAEEQPLAVSDSHRGDPIVINDEGVPNADGAMHTIRRLNLPKVLPDFPLQEAANSQFHSPGQYATLTGRTRASLVSAPSESDAASAIVYSVPKTVQQQSKSPGTKQRKKSPGKQQQQQKKKQSIVQAEGGGGGGGPECESSNPTIVADDVTERQQNPIRSKNKSMYSTPGSFSSNGGGVGTSAHFANTPLVVAPHPRLSHPIKALYYSTAAVVAAAAPASQSESEPEPCLIVRPGIKQNQQTQEQPTLANKDDAVDEVVVLRQQQQPNSATAGARPGSRNSRSWYAQYSQSFISQSLDQEPESKEDEDI